VSVGPPGARCCPSWRKRGRKTCGSGLETFSHSRFGPAFTRGPVTAFPQSVHRHLRCLGAPSYFSVPFHQNLCVGRCLLTSITIREDESYGCVDDGKACEVSVKEADDVPKREEHWRSWTCFIWEDQRQVNDVFSVSAWGGAVFVENLGRTGSRRRTARLSWARGGCPKGQSRE